MDQNQPLSLTARLSLAFYFQYNVILLGGALAFSLALASPVPAELGAMGEIIWLLAACWFDGILVFIEAQTKGLQAEPRAAAARPVGQVLDAALQNRSAALKRAIDDILRAGRKKGRLSRADARATATRLDAIRTTFERLAQTHQRASRFLAEVRDSDLEADLARITEALSIEKDPMVKMGLRQALGTTQRRRKELLKIGNTLRAIEVQLGTIEASFAYLKSMVFGVASAPQLQAEIAAMAAQISSADEWDAEAALAMDRAGGSSFSLHSLQS